MWNLFACTDAAALIGSLLLRKEIQGPRDCRGRLEKAKARCSKSRGTDGSGSTHPIDLENLFMSRTSRKPSLLLRLILLLKTNYMSIVVMNSGALDDRRRLIENLKGPTKILSPFGLDAEIASPDIQPNTVPPTNQSVRANRSPKFDRSFHQKSNAEFILGE